VRVEWGLERIVLVIRQYKKSQIVVLLSDEKCDCTVLLIAKNAYTVANNSQEN